MILQFFRAMRTHYQLVDEVEEYSNLVRKIEKFFFARKLRFIYYNTYFYLQVDQSRASLDYVGAKVMEALREVNFGYIKTCIYASVILT